MLEFVGFFRAIGVKWQVTVARLDVVWRCIAPNCLFGTQIEGEKRYEREREKGMSIHERD